MPSDFDPESVKYYEIHNDADALDLDDGNYVRADDYDSLLSISRSQQERIAELEGAERDKFHGALQSANATCERRGEELKKAEDLASVYCHALQRATYLIDAGTAEEKKEAKQRSPRRWREYVAERRSLLSKPEGGSIDSSKAR